MLFTTLVSTFLKSGVSAPPKVEFVSSSASKKAIILVASSAFASDSCISVSMSGSLVFESSELASVKACNAAYTITKSSCRGVTMKSEFTPTNRPFSIG